MTKLPVISGRDCGRARLQPCRKVSQSSWALAPEGICVAPVFRPARRPTAVRWDKRSVHSYVGAEAPTRKNWKRHVAVVSVLLRAPDERVLQRLEPGALLGSGRAPVLHRHVVPRGLCARSAGVLQMHRRRARSAGAYSKGTLRLRVPACRLGTCVPIPPGNGASRPGRPLLGPNTNPCPPQIGRGCRDRQQNCEKC